MASTDCLDMSNGLSAKEKSSGVTLFTRASVHWADKRTATRRVNGSLCSRGMGREDTVRSIYDRSSPPAHSISSFEVGKHSLGVQPSKCDVTSHSLS